MSVITPDEIVSVIKERIDNFELNVDSSETNDIICGSSEQLKDVINEQAYYLHNRHQPSDFQLTTANEIFKKENHPYGWYRKFEKKRF
jgi:hypothetical protein